MVLTDISDSETLEILACREGLVLRKDLLLHNLVLASDCANVVQSIKDEAMGPYGQIVREIKTTVREFQSIHEGRGSNVDAHNLARSSLYKVLGLVFRSASRRV